MHGASAVLASEVRLTATFVFLTTVKITTMGVPPPVFCLCQLSRKYGLHHFSSFLPISVLCTALLMILISNFVSLPIRAVDIINTTHG